VIVLRTALQKNVAYALPTWASAAKMKPNRPCVTSRDMFSTSVTRFSASARWELGHMAVMTPLAAGAEPEPRGNRNAAREKGSGLAREREEYHQVSTIPR
jgi:hypothetical protein